jgi:hypothetical protein
MRYRGIIKITLAALLSITALAQQAPQPPQPQGTALVEGTVVRAGSVPPSLVPRARVVLSTIPDRNAPATAPFITRTAVTDNSGRFQLSDVPAGNYSLMASRDGYNRATTTIGVEATKSLTGVSLEMVPVSAISGRIRNRAGVPLANVTVQAHRYAYQVGRRVLIPVQSTLTDDLGQFRLFYLPAGRYVISAKPDAGPVLSPGLNVTNMRASANPGVPQVGNLSGVDVTFSVTGSVRDFLSVGLVPAAMTGTAYVSIYFPGTTDFTAATPIDLKAGEDFTGADFVVSEARAARISGKILNGVTGEPAKSPVTVMLLGTDTPDGGRPPRTNGTVAADGSFEFRAVPPGSYDLVSMIGAIPQGMVFGANGYPGGANINGGGPPRPAGFRDFSVDATGIRLSARVPVVVRDADIKDLVVSAQVGFTVKGRVRVEGRTAEESQKLLEGAHVQIQPDSSTFEIAPMPALIRPDGTFTAVGAIPGSYQVWVMNAAGFAGTQPYVKSVTLGGVDAINPRFVIDREPLGELEVVVGTARGSAQIAVVDAKQAPAKSATLVFVPDTPLRQHFDLYQNGRTNDSGTAQMNMPTGSYTAYAFETIDVGSLWDPEVLQKYSGQGVAVRIEPSGTQSVNLKLIPAR